MINLRNGLVVAASFALALPVAAQAHPKLVSSSPAANAVVSAPKTLELRFNEKLVGQFSGVDLAMTDMPGMKMGAPMKIPAAAGLGPDGKSLVVKPARPLSAGTYQLVWHAVAADTHRVNGSISFKVK